MATKKFTVPNWGQAVIARAINLDPKNVTVAHENDRLITFLQFMPREEIIVCKIDGAVIRS